jgi:hypothetical protein
MVTTRRSNPVQDEIQEEVRRPNLGRDDACGEAEFAGLEARITQLSQQLAQAQKNVEDLLAQNALLIAAQTPPALNHDAVEGTNPNGNLEGLGERAESRIEDRMELINPVPPPPTNAERRLQQMVLDLDAKYDALSRTMDQKRDGKESPVDNLFQHKESIFTELKKYPTSTCPEGLRYSISLFFQVVKTQWSIWIIFDLTCPCTRHLMLWRAELFPSLVRKGPRLA